VRGDRQLPPPLRRPPQTHPSLKSPTLATRSAIGTGLQLGRPRLLHRIVANLVISLLRTSLAPPLRVAAFLRIAGTFQAPRVVNHSGVRCKENSRTRRGDFRRPLRHRTSRCRIIKRSGIQGHISRTVLDGPQISLGPNLANAESEGKLGCA
jgi:hypothetical protein